MSDAPSLILQTVVRSAIEATGAAQGWLLAIDDDELVVRATVGIADPLVGARVALHSGFAGYVASSGQPLAMSPRRDDERGGQGVAGLVGIHPGSVLAVPCGTDDAVHGVLELVDKHGGGPFSFDDVELATLLAGIAGAALESDAALGTQVATPRELGENLTQLAATDPSRYATVANFLTAVLSDG